LFSNVKQLSGRAKSAPVVSESVIMVNEVMRRVEFCMWADDNHDRDSVFSFPVLKLFKRAYADFVLIFKFLALSFSSAIQGSCAKT
jgi:hypothetical protein